MGEYWRKGVGGMGQDSVLYIVLKGVDGSGLFLEYVLCNGMGASDR